MGDVTRLTAEDLEQYRGELLGWAKNEVGEGADDLVQQTFTEAIPQLGEVREDTRAWLFGIARNLVRVEFRKKKRKKKVETRDPADVPEPSEEINPGEELADDEGVVQAVQFFLGAPAVHFETLKALVQSGSNLNAAAEKLGCSPSLVRKRRDALVAMAQEHGATNRLEAVLRGMERIRADNELWGGRELLKMMLDVQIDLYVHGPKFRCIDDQYIPHDWTTFWDTTSFVTLHRRYPELAFSLIFTLRKELIEEGDAYAAHQVETFLRSQASITPRLQDLGEYPEVARFLATPQSSPPPDEHEGRRSSCRVSDEESLKDQTRADRVLDRLRGRLRFFTDQPPAPE